MLRSLPSLALLALAAALSAQTASLAPVARGGFALGTQSVWSPVRTFRAGFFESGKGFGGGRLTVPEGWAAEYDLSALPTGSRIVSATLASSLTGLEAGSLSLDFRGYAGNGTVEPADMGAGALLATLSSPAWSSGRLDVAAALQTRLDAGDQYAGFSLAPHFGKSGGAAWSTPSLNIAYVVDHGLAKGGWPTLNGSLSGACAGGPVTSSGVFADAPIPGRLLAVGPNGWMYVSKSGTVFALDATGAQRWSWTIANGYANAGLSADGTLYVVTRDLTAIDAATGAVRWSVNLDTNNGDGIQAQILDDGTVVAVNEQGIAGFDRAGNKLWLQRGLPNGASVSDDGVVVAAIRDGLYCFDAHTGAVTAQYDLGDRPFTSLPIVTGTTATWAATVQVGGPVHTVTYRPIPGNPNHTYRAGTTTQAFAANLYTASVHGGTPTVLQLRTGTTIAYSPYVPLQPPFHTGPSSPTPPPPPIVYPDVKFPPSDLIFGQLGKAPNGTLVVPIGGETDLYGPSGVVRMAAPVGAYAISADNVLYGDIWWYDQTLHRDRWWTSAYDLTTGKQLWSTEAPYPAEIRGAPMIGVGGAIWHSLPTPFGIQRVR